MPHCRIMLRCNGAHIIFGMAPAGTPLKRVFFRRLNIARVGSYIPPVEPHVLTILCGSTGEHISYGSAPVRHARSGQFCPSEQYTR